jgi:hypothetical protein
MFSKFSYRAARYLVEVKVQEESIEAKRCEEGFSV